MPHKSFLHDSTGCSPCPWRLTSLPTASF